MIKYIFFKNLAHSGKVQKLKDKQFGKVSMFKPHADNPPARIVTPIKHYKAYSLTRAYAGETFFWGLAPAAGDTITIKLNQPTALEKYRWEGRGEEDNDDDSNNNNDDNVKTIMIIHVGMLRMMNRH